MATLAELTDEIGEVVGNGLAQGIVVDRAKSASKIAGTLLPGLLVRRRRFLRARSVVGSLRLTSFLGTQLSSPLARAQARVIQILT
jgi:hypothetical protein